MSDPGDDAHRAHTFAVVRREAQARDLFRRAPRYDRPLQKDVWGVVASALVGGPIVAFGWLFLRLHGEERWLFGLPLAGVGAFILFQGGLALRRIVAVRRGPLTADVTRVRIDWHFERRRTTKGPSYQEEIQRAWIETELGGDVEVFVAPALFVELPLDGWGVAFLRGRVLVDFARVRVPHVTEGHLETR